MFYVVWGDGSRPYGAALVGTCGFVLLLILRHAWNFVHAFLAHKKAATPSGKVRRNIRVGYKWRSSPSTLGEIAMMTDHHSLSHCGVFF